MTLPICERLSPPDGPAFGGVLSFLLCGGLVLFIPKAVFFNDGLCADASMLRDVLDEDIGKVVGQFLLLDSPRLGDRIGFFVR